MKCSIQTNSKIFRSLWGKITSNLDRETTSRMRQKGKNRGTCAHVLKKIEHQLEEWCSVGGFLGEIVR